LLINLTSLSSQTAAFSLPVTIDISGRLSVYAGINMYASRTDGCAWTSMIVDSWSAGFQVAALEQNGALPSVTVQSTFTQSIGGIVSATGTANILEFGYAVLKVGNSTIGYLGAYHQWPDKRKLTGRLGIQAFEGASLGALVQIKPSTLPILRFYLDRLTDEDQIRFGITAEVAWAPNPTIQLTLRTPITLR
jgi:hypothetical protein